VNDGYIYLHRRLFESRLWSMPPDVLRLGVYLMLEAHYEAKPIKLPDVLIQRGEVVTSLSDIAKGCRWYENRKARAWSRQKVSRMLDQLVAVGFCRYKSDSYGTHIRLCNYEDFQRRPARKSDSHGTPMEHPRDTPETVKGARVPEKEEKEERREEPPAPKGSDAHNKAVKEAEIPPELAALPTFLDNWQMYCDERRNNRKYMSANAVRLNLAKLLKFPNGAVAALEDAVSGGYQGVFPKHAPAQGVYPPLPPPTSDRVEIGNTRDGKPFYRLKQGGQPCHSDGLVM